MGAFQATIGVENDTNAIIALTLIPVMTFKSGFCRLALCLAVALPTLPATAEVHEYRLANGLKLLVKEDHRAPVAVSQVWYKVGSSYEHDGITGVSHVLEHMMFNGTANHPDDAFSRIISENGGRDNAFTGRDYTAYFQILEASRLAVSFELEADRMSNLVLREEKFETELEVVKEERRLRTEDNPVAYLYEAALATAYQTSPYRHPIVGWMADLDAMKLAHLETWYQRWYAPNNAIVVVVGDVDPEATRQLALKHFGPLEPAPLSPPRAASDLAQQGQKRITVKRPAEVPHLWMGYKTPALEPGGADWEPYALEVLAGALSGGDSARFAANLVRGQEIAASLSASYSLAARLDGLFIIQGAPARGKTLEALEQAVRAQLEALRETPVSQREMARIKAQVISSEVYERDSLFHQALVLGFFETVGLSWRLAEDYAARVQEVTAEQVQAVAKRYFQDDGLTVAALAPQPIAREAPP